MFRSFSLLTLNVEEKIPLIKFFLVSWIAFDDQSSDFSFANFESTFVGSPGRNLAIEICQSFPARANSLSKFQCVKVTREITGSGCRLENMKRKS